VCSDLAPITHSPFDGEEFTLKGFPSILRSSVSKDPLKGNKGER
jgi:hypothetical protein